MNARPTIQALCIGALCATSPACTEVSLSTASSAECEGSSLAGGPLEAALHCRHDPIAGAMRSLGGRGRATVTDSGTRDRALTGEGISAEAVGSLTAVSLPLGRAVFPELGNFTFPDGVGGFVRLVLETANQQCPDAPLHEKFKTFVISDTLVGVPEAPDLFWCDDSQTSLCEACEHDPELLCESEFFVCADPANGDLCKPCDDGSGGECPTEFLPFPRVIATTCPQDLSQRGKAFFALSFDDGAGDVDGQSVEAFAWDDQSERYEFYRSVPLEHSDSEVQSNGLLMITNPLELPDDSAIDRCDLCHKGNTDQSGQNRDAVPNVPIMNELVEPWAHWNAQPFGPSQKFHLPQHFAEGMPKFKNLTYHPSFSDAPDAYQGNFLLSDAAAFEDVVRAGFEVVGRSRSARAARPVGDTPRERLAATREALQLLHPLFCEEHVNFASEKDSSTSSETTGLFTSFGPVLDVGLRNLMPDTLREFEWVSSEPPMLRTRGQASGAAIELLAMRGQASLAYEKELLRTGVLSRDQITQIRMLDWRSPVLSYFRCSLWERMDAAVSQAEADTDLHGEEADELVPGATVGEKMSNLLAEILRLPVDGLPREDWPSLAAPDAGAYLALILPEEESLQRARLEDLGRALACVEGTLTSCDGVEEVPDALDCVSGSECDLSACEDRGFCRLNHRAFAEWAREHLAGFRSAEGRRRLETLRDRRLCVMTGEGAIDVRVQGWAGFPGLPALPGDFDPAVDCAD